ncbi:ABC-F family ATP-binding cassette domain-containing protein [Bifidobacterium sp. 82T24]|uniref:ATP-binding cassette domain-containing protein n=1 Tax=Bifidobacterium pluvialisilvae TaxID=2834436 RepID=UPI001C57A12C|nr:ATP-binding cassette domain-containing protein [Bifidobacterium pluvialisilvae]MBW3087387.1 ABC-F family ATP-binding cassette domain-containing protein [Bifidobacterium pluvialisilvae]
MQPSILTLSGITFTYPDAPEPLFDDVSASFPAGWTAVIGDNGIGKTTLMSVVRGAVIPDAGTMAPDPRRMIVGHCPQSIAVPPPNLDDFAADWSPESIAVRDSLDVGDDWTYRYDELSGGERKRLQIACALARRPDVLILDEPTNHVDAATRDRIITAMHGYRGIGIVISHDESFIDATCGRCVVFERRHIGTRNVTVVNTYSGGWTQAADLIAARAAADESSLAAARRETARLEAVRTQRLAKVRQVEAEKRHGERIDRRDHDARNRRQLAKMTGLDRGVTRAYAQLDGRLDATRRRRDGLTTAAKRYDGDIWMAIEPSRRREMLRLEAGVIRFGESDTADGRKDDDSRIRAVLCRTACRGNHILLSPPPEGVMPEGLMVPTISLGPRDHVAVTGPNGSGKSTLLRALVAHAADVPKLIIPQDTTDADADQALTRLDELDDDDRSRVLGAYARLNADADRLLSGGRPSPGELRKLLLCLALPARPQLIVMDEPTNHLDLTSKKALARLLTSYPGALIVVSHDERFLDAVIRP